MQNFLLLDSRDREGTTTQSDCQFSVRQGLFNLVAMELVSFTCPLTIYNVVAGINDKIYINDGTPYTATLTAGNYDYITICTEIDRALDATASALTFTSEYSHITFRITITGSSAFIIAAGATSVYQIIGFDNVTTSSSITQVGGNAINLSVPTYIGINLDCLGTSTISSNQYSNNTFTVFCQDVSSDIFTWNSNAYNTQKVLCTNDNIYNINVRLRTWGNVVPAFNGSDWSMLLKLHYKDDIDNV